MPSKIDIYLERYCGKHKITPEEAMTHKIVQEVKTHYEEIDESCDVILEN